MRQSFRQTLLGGGVTEPRARRAPRQHGAPVGILDAAGSRLGDELAQHCASASGSSRCGKCAAPGSVAKRCRGSPRGRAAVAAAGSCGRARPTRSASACASSRYRRSVALTRCPCTSMTDAQRVQEGARAHPAFSSGRSARAIACRWTPAPHAPRAQARARRAACAASRRGWIVERQQRRHARQRGAAQQRADLAPEAAARDQHQALDALGELVEELHRHAAAERVPDDRRALDADRREQVADAGGVRAERVVAARRGRVAVADQVGRDHRVVARPGAAPRPPSGARS